MSKSSEKARLAALEAWEPFESIEVERAKYWAVKTARRASGMPSRHPWRLRRNQTAIQQEIGQAAGRIRKLKHRAKRRRPPKARVS